jgi:hypothetical protein
MAATVSRRLKPVTKPFAMDETTKTINSSQSGICRRRTRPLTGGAYVPVDLGHPTAAPDQ